MDARTRSAALLWGLGLWLVALLLPAWSLPTLGWRGGVALTLPLVSLGAGYLGAKGQAGTWVVLALVASWWLEPELLREMLRQDLWSGLSVGMAALCVMRMCTAFAGQRLSLTFTLQAFWLLVVLLGMALPVWQFQGNIAWRTGMVLVAFALTWLFVVWVPHQRVRAPQGLNWSIASAFALTGLLLLWHLGEAA